MTGFTLHGNFTPGGDGVPRLPNESRGICL